MGKEVLKGLCLMIMLAPNIYSMEPPKVRKLPFKIKKHSHVRIDNYYWLRERDNPEVIKYLKAENRYADFVMRDTQNLQEKLFTEMKSRIKKDDSSVPFKFGNYYYYKRYRKQGEYPIYARKHRSLKNAEEIIVDVNKLAEGKPFCHVKFPVPSSANKFVAFAADFKGRRFYSIYVKNMETNKIVSVIKNTSGNFVWANDEKTLFYVKQNPETLRWERVHRHKIEPVRKKDEEVYFEKDETFDVSLYKSKNHKFIFIRSGATLSTEYRYLSADNPEGKFKVFCPRAKKLEYEVDDGGDAFYVLNNENARNFKISRVPYYDTRKKNWEEIIPHREDVYIEYFDIFKDWLVVKERKGGTGYIKVLKRPSFRGHEIKFSDPVFMTDVGDNFEYNTDVFRFTYESLTTPYSVYDYNMREKTRILKKRQKVLGDFKPENYASKRIWAQSRDGVKIPVSLVYRKNLFRKGKNPLHVYGYGSYGAVTGPYFSSNRLSLLDRGVVCAIVHVRGGAELGRRWYENGKLLKKKNTFYDFIDATKALIKESYGANGHIYAEGGSAGGLLVGAVSNMAPHLYRGIIAEVPFVDVVTTMLDDSIPLTTSEYDEWGNPDEKKYYDYMLSYSPYDNVEKKDYPNMLITAGLEDSQVQYWEPAKWVAKLRDLKTDDNMLILKTDMKVGHGGKTGRFESLRLVAFEYAFLLKLEGIKE